MAGVIAGGYSTFDSIGIGISSLFVRDIYARFIVRNESDAHYTRIGRITVPFIIALGFAYVPFIQEGMLLFYLRLAGAIAVPLMTVILMGIFTRVHRATGHPFHDRGDGLFARLRRRCDLTGALLGPRPDCGAFELPCALGAR